MKRYLLSIFLGLATAGFGQTKVGVINDYDLVKVGDLTGLMDPSGEEKIKPGPYTNISYNEEIELYRCYIGKEFEIWLEDYGKVETDYLFTGIRVHDYDLFEVKSKTGVGIIYDGKLVVPPIYDKIEVEAETYFGCCMNYIVYKDGKKGIYADSKLMIEPIYDELELSENFYEAIITVKGKKKGLIQTNYYEGTATELLKPEYDKFEILEYFEGYVLLTKDKKVGLVNLFTDSLTVLLPVEYSSISYSEEFYFDEEVLFLTKSKKFGFYSVDRDSIILPVKYNVKGLKKKEELYYGTGFIIRNINEGNGSALIINYSDRFEYREVAGVEQLPDVGLLVILNSNKKFQLLDDDENLMLLPIEFDDFKFNFDYSFLGVQQGDKWHIFNKYENPRLSEGYDTFEELEKVFIDKYY